MEIDWQARQRDKDGSCMDHCRRHWTMMEKDLGEWQDPQQGSSLDPPTTTGIKTQRYREPGTEWHQRDHCINKTSKWKEPGRDGMVNFKNLPITHHRLTVSCSLRQTRPTTLRFTSLSPLFPPCATHHLHSWLRTGYYLQNRRAAGKDAMDAKISSLSTNPYWKTPRCRPRKYKPMAQTYFTEGRDRGPDHCCVRSNSCEQILPPLHHQGWY